MLVQRSWVKIGRGPADLGQVPEYFLCLFRIHNYGQDFHLGPTMSTDVRVSAIGLGRREYSSGDLSKMITSWQFNHRLKDIFMTAARNFVRYNPDSHLNGYFRNLVKSGMKATEAYKRVARALVCMIFRKLKSLIQDNWEEDKRRESDMTSGSDIRSDIGHICNISLSSPNEDDLELVGKIKIGKVGRTA